MNNNNETKTEQEQAIESAIEQCKPDIVAGNYEKAIKVTKKEITGLWKDFIYRDVDDQDLHDSTWVPTANARMTYKAIMNLVHAWNDSENYQCEYSSIEEAKEDIIYRARCFGLVPWGYHVEVAETANGIVSVFYYVDYFYFFGAED